MKLPKKTSSDYGTDYITFKRVLTKLKLPRAIADELAVLLVEIKEPIIGVAEHLHQICRTRKCSRRELIQLIDLVAYQWQFHTEDFDLTLRKVVERGYLKQKKPRGQSKFNKGKLKSADLTVVTKASNPRKR